MDSRHYSALDRKIKKLRRIPKEAGKAGRRPAIEFLLGMLEKEQSAGERLQTVSMLVHEYAHEFDLVGEEWARRECIRLQPGHPYPQAALAMFLWLSCIDMTEALSVARKAVKLSIETGIAPIHSLGVQARVARKAKDWDLFASSLSSLMAGFGNRGGPDIGYERDFMVRLPRSAPDRVLYKEYENFKRRRDALRAGGQVHKDLDDLQTLEWWAGIRPEHVAKPEELALIDRCCEFSELILPAAGGDNWREILRAVVDHTRQQISLIDQILLALQRNAGRRRRSTNRDRAYDAMASIKGEGLQRLARNAIEFLTRDQ